MRTLSALLVVSLFAIVAVDARAAEEDLVLRRAVLSTGGVGYFEFEATVDGDRTLSFDVRLDQVDDVLKSLVVFDSSGGVSSVSLPGRAGLADLFRDLPFGADALGSPADLLRALIGAEVKIAGRTTIEGRILSIVPETVQLEDGATLTRHRITVMGADGLAQAILEDAEDISFADPELEAQISGALADLSQHRVQDRRTLNVTVKGDGERTVRVGYVVEMPLWKTTYRLALSDNNEALLQGWAVLENMSGQDWNDVELTLVSGNPVTFRQALYESYYVPRPQVPVDVAGRVLPPVDEGAVGVATRAVEAEGSAPTGSASAQDQAVYFEALAAAPAPEPDYAGLEAAAGEEAATQVVFRVPNTVTVERGNSLMVPLVDQTLTVEPIALYSPDVQSRHPLASVRLTNTTGIGLPPGVVTIYESSGVSGGETFVGDARLGALPAGDSRLISYAVDQKTLIDREDDYVTTVTQVRIDRGVLYVKQTDSQTTTYTIEAPAGEARDVILEHPRQYGWELASPKTDVEKTENAYRITVAVAAGETKTVKVILEQPREESFALLTMPDTQVMYFADSGDVPADVRQAFKQLAELKGAMAETQRNIDEVERQHDTLLEEQSRLRQNLDAVPGGSDLQARYLQKLAEQEDAIEALLTKRDDLQTELATRRQALADFVKNLTIGSSG